MIENEGVAQQTIQRLLQLKKSPPRKEKYNLVQKNRSADKKKRTISAKRLGDELPTVAQIIPILRQTPSAIGRFWKYD